MIVTERVELEDSNISIFENGSVQINRGNGSTEYLSAEEVNAIIENNNV